MIDFKKRLKNKYGKYNYIDTLEKIQELDNYLMDSNDEPNFDLIAYDTETNGLSHKLNTVVGFSLSVNDHAGFYIPMLEWRPKKDSLKTRKVAKVQVNSYMEGEFINIWDGKTYPEDVRADQVEIPEIFPYILKRWFTHESVNLLMHNAPFDCNMTHATYGVELTNNLFCDTVLLKQFLDENTKNSLKFVADLWKEQLGFDPYKDAAMEQKELGNSIIQNGGTYNAKTKHVWRASPEFMGKYACADTFLTFKVFEEGMRQFEQKFEEKHLKLFFETEIMPLCREVVIPMQRRGVAINVKHFEKLQKETIIKMSELEDQIHELLGDKLNGFSMGQSRDEAIGKKAFLHKLMELEGLASPQKYDKKTDTYKDTLAKKEVQAEYDKNPHWFWGYLLGEDEIKYSDKKINNIKNEMYVAKTGRRYHFNIGSVYHLRWLFIDKLGHDPTELPQTKSATKENPLPEMGAEVLNEYFSDYDFVKPLLLWKKLQKLLGTYITPAIELNVDGRLYMNMNQAGTTSGRFACSGGYNLQTLPKVEEYDKCYKCESKNVTIEHSIEILAKQTCNDCGNVVEDILCSSAIKEGFIAPKGMKIINADYSSLEPRCFAFVSGDKKLKEIYWNDLDMYSKVYCDTMDQEGKYSSDPKADNFLKKLNKAARDMVKPVILGIAYGARGPQVANLMGFKTIKTDRKTGEQTEVTDFQRGQDYRDTFLATYKDLYKYMIMQEALANSQGWVENYIGRRRTFLVAPVVFRVLQNAGIHYESFLDTGKKKLQGKSAEINGCLLDSETLRTLFKDLKIDIEEAKVKGNFNWAYIKAKYKNDLDNAKNFPIQSLAAHICNMGMLDTTRMFVAAGMTESYVFIQVHDEIGCYTPEEDTEACIAMLQSGMEDNVFAKLLDIEMIAEPLIANTLKEAK